MFVQSAILSDVPNHHRRRVVQSSRHEYGGAGDAGNPTRLDRSHELLDRNEPFAKRPRHRQGAAVPYEHDPVHDGRQQEGNISPSDNLSKLATKRPKSTQMKAPAAPPANGRLQPQTSRMAMNRSAEVISMVADTAMP